MTFYKCYKTTKVATTLHYNLICHLIYKSFTLVTIQTYNWLAVKAQLKILPCDKIPSLVVFKKNSDERTIDEQK